MPGGPGSRGPPRTAPRRPGRGAKPRPRARKRRPLPAPRPGRGRGGGARLESTGKERRKITERSGTLRTDGARVGCASPRRCLLGLGPLRCSNPVDARSTPDGCALPRSWNPTGTRSHLWRRRTTAACSVDVVDRADWRALRQPPCDLLLPGKPQVSRHLGASKNSQVSFMLAACRLERAGAEPPRPRGPWSPRSARRGSRRPTPPGRDAPGRRR